MPPRRSNSHPILHVFGWDRKFVLPFIDFVQENFDLTGHSFVIYGSIEDDQTPIGPHVSHYPRLLKSLPALLAHMHGAKKIILHGIFSSHLLYVLALQPWLLKKCYWTIWGGDLYIHNSIQKDWRWHKDEWFRRFVVSRLGHFITQIEGDYELARQWYGARGRWHECFMYPSNLHKDYAITSQAHHGVNILLGNSASPTNNHLEAFERLRPFVRENIRIYCPLSYGDAEYAEEVIRVGADTFGDKFVPLRDFLSFEKYLGMLSVIDVAIFNHNRQQGMGNITTLLGLGKKVYLRRCVSSWDSLESLGVKLFDIVSLDLGKLPEATAKRNSELIKIKYSKANLIKGLREIFE